MSDNKKMILNLFAALQESLFVGDRFPKGEMVSFMQPGHFISPNIKEGSGSDDMAIQADLTNILIDTSYVNKYKDIEYSSSAELLGSVQNVYEDLILQASLPIDEIDEDTLKKIDDLRKWLSNNIENYSSYSDKYFDIVDALDLEQAKEKPNQAKIKILNRKKRTALNNWETFGLKKIHERKNGTLNQLTGPNPASRWDDFRFQLNEQKRTSPNLGEYYQTFLSPPISEWGGEWPSIEREISESDSYDYSRSTSWSGGVSANFGLFSFGGGASGSKDYEYHKSNIKNINLRLEYQRVRIVRPWMRSDIFGYKYWTWKKNFSKEFISDGGNLFINPPKRPIGRMPLLPEYLIVVKNVELSAIFSSKEREFVKKILDTNASAGWGPFSIKGSYKDETSSTTVKASFDGTTIRIPHPQIIARSGKLLPMTPNPDPSFNWIKDEAWIPSKEDFKNLNSRRKSDLENDLKQIKYYDEKENLLHELDKKYDKLD